MSIKLYVPRSLSGITKGKDVFEVDGETVGECLGRLLTLIPRIKEEAVCPASFIETEDRALEDPKEKTLEQVRSIRDEIKEGVTKILNELE
jgi:protein-tyrosine-phosphatase